MTSNEVMKGTCNCGAVSIEFPKTSCPGSCVKCHCQGCRASSGGLFSVNLPIPRKDVKVNGTPKIYQDGETMSGKAVHRNFCGDCGCAVFSTAEVEDHKTAYVKGGLFTKNGIEIPPPGAEIFWHRREQWEEPTAGIKPQ
ncbi:uncharacterized protein LY89DRAFT_690244 [Mollisia scopiformis]|uniref:CENP-V/GFA domain-containing protein n=1 Tax=Mollisia scopiformis TaxID=149040 RepID=A0A132BBU9_MOLSC|nr:uncharacterized protein LY89DRAFT_690244 [Mollisia scopiformis]KUJ09848.1 hypothetical protein LY89DRAFT_690244 [Mollisia scopiformis]